MQNQPAAPKSPSNNASTTDLLTALKAVVTAISNQTSNETNLQGGNNFAALTATTLVKLGVGRVVNISVIVNGSGPGTVYDTNNVTDTTRPIFVIPDTSATLYEVNMPFLYGLVIAPGTGQTISGSYT